MTAHTPDALASALPAGIKYYNAEPGVFWNATEIANFQTLRLREAGYVLVNLDRDEATVERLAIALVKSEAVSWDLNVQACRDHYTRLAEAALAALADTQQEVSE